MTTRKIHWKATQAFPLCRGLSPLLPPAAPTFSVSSSAMAAEGQPPTPALPEKQEQEHQPQDKQESQLEAGMGSLLRPLRLSLLPAHTAGPAVQARRR